MNNNKYELHIYFNDGTYVTNADILASDELLVSRIRDEEPDVRIIEIGSMESLSDKKHLITEEVS